MIVTMVRGSLSARTAVVLCRSGSLGQRGWAKRGLASKGEEESSKVKGAEAFTRMGLSPDFETILEELKVSTPTPVQIKAIPKLLELGYTARRPDIDSAGAPPESETTPRDGQSEQATPRNIVVAAEPGGGKTLAFLLPIMELVKREEIASGRIEHRVARPRALILAPTRELATQIGQVAKKLSHGINLRTVCITGGTRQSDIKRKTSAPADIFVTTPAMALVLRDQAKKLFLGSVKHIVVDEADVICGEHDGFRQEMTSLLAPMVEKGNLLNKVWVGATILEGRSQRAAREAKQGYGRDDNSATALAWIRMLARGNQKPKRDDPPAVEILRTPKLGLLPEGLVFDVQVGSETSMHPQLLSALRSLENRQHAGSQRILVFCNSIASCRSTNHCLESEQHLDDVAVYSVHGGMSPAMRDRQMSAFMAADEEQDSVDGGPRKSSGPRNRILVATDIVSRGLDFSRKVDHIIMFDLPGSVSDFIHRIGRTARGEGTPGKVTLLSRGTRRDERLVNLLLAAVPRNVVGKRGYDSSGDARSDVARQLDFEASRFRNPVFRQATKHARLRGRKSPQRFQVDGSEKAPKVPQELRNPPMKVQQSLFRKVHGIQDDQVSAS